MTTPTVPHGTPPALVARALLRALATAVVLVFLYYHVPMNRPTDSRNIVLFLVCLTALAGIIAWQVRTIMNSRYPGLRAIEALAATTPLYILLFASTYFLMEQASSAAFTEPLTRTDALYFSVTVFSSVGFGDIAPKTEGARLVVTAQMFLDLIVLGLAVKVFLGAVRVGRQRQSEQQE